MDAKDIYSKERLKNDWINDLNDFQDSMSESEKETCRRDAKSTMMLGISLYGFEFADELQEIRKEVLR